jgi:FMN phosphatase YigB (HAD superfamily)
LSHPPVANRTVCIDFDGTIVPWGELFADKEPFPGVREAMHRLRDAGYRIVIFTSRLSDYWLRLDPQARGRLDQLEYISALLTRHGIPYDAITAEKVPAEYYFDDRAVQISDDYPLATALNTLLDLREVMSR